MTTLLRRLSTPCLFIGLTTLLSLSSSLAWAGPPEGEEPPADAVEAPADAAEPAPAGETEPAPVDEAPPAKDEPAKDEPAKDEPVEDEPEITSPETEEPTEPDSPQDDDVAAAKAPTNLGSKHSIIYSNLLAVRVNPLLAADALVIGYQYRLYDKDKTILNGSNIGIFLRPIVSPANAVLGATFQIQPAAVLRLRATYSFVGWFGTFGYMQSYTSPHDDYSETRLDAQADAGENYTNFGQQVELEALVQAKVKNIAIRSTTTVLYNHYDLRGDDDLFYSPRFDLLVPGQGWMLNNDSEVLWIQPIKGERKATAIFGVRATTLMPFFSDEVYEEGDERTNPVGPQFRLGPMLGYTFYNRPDQRPRFNKPTLLLMSQWNIKHRWRSGRDVKAGYPTILFVFAFSGELWGRD